MKSSLTTLIGAFVFGVVALVAYGIWYGKVASKSAEVADLQNQITAASDSVAQLTSARAALAQISNDEAAMRRYFVSEADVVPFIDGLEQLAASAGATTTVLSVSTAGTNAKPILQLALSIEGTFNAVMRSVGSVEYAPYDLQITGLSLRQDTAGGWNANVNLSVGSIAATSTKQTP